MAQERTSSLENRIAKLRANRVSGAVDLALEALDLADGWLASGLPAAGLAEELRDMHPAIATVANVARLLEEPSADVRSRLATTRSSLLEGNERIAGQIKPLIPADSRIVTLSNSSTVREALFVVAPAAVYVMQSLPGAEGETQARELERGFGGRGLASTVEVVPDSSLANVVPLVDCALVGIDSYNREGSVLHKVGTLPLALCCRQFGKPLYAAGHSLKFADRKFHGLADSSLGAGEQMFDCTPADLVTAIVTEESAS